LVAVAGESRLLAAPDRYVCGLKGLVDDADQVMLDRVQVDGFGRRAGDSYAEQLTPPAVRDKGSFWPNGPQR
jgi:hypothetical protein